MNDVKLIKRFFQLEIKDIAYFKFILESYEGIAMQRTLNAKRGEIEVMVPDCNMSIFNDILNNVRAEMDIREIKKPVDYLELVI